MKEKSLETPQKYNLPRFRTKTRQWMLLGVFPKILSSCIGPIEITHRNALYALYKFIHCFSYKH